MQYVCAAQVRNGYCAITIPARHINTRAHTHTTTSHMYECVPARQYRFVSTSKVDPFAASKSNYWRAHGLQLNCAIKPKYVRACHSACNSATVTATHTQTRIDGWQSTPWRFEEVGLPVSNVGTILLVLQSNVLCDACCFRTPCGVMFAVCMCVCFFCVCFRICERARTSAVNFADIRRGTLRDLDGTCNEHPLRLPHSVGEWVRVYSIT